MQDKDQAWVPHSTNRLYVKTKAHPRGELIMGEEVDGWLLEQIKEREKEIIKGMVKYHNVHLKDKECSPRWLGGHLTAINQMNFLLDTKSEETE